MDLDTKSRDHTPFRHSYVNDKCLFLVDFLSQRSQSAPGFSTVESKPKTQGRPYYRGRNQRMTEIVDKKRKERSAIRLGQKQKIERQKLEHRRNKSRRARLRNRYWTSLKFALPLTRNRHLKDSITPDPSWPTTHQFNYSEFVKTSLDLRHLPAATTLQAVGRVQFVNPQLSRITPDRSITVDRRILTSKMFVHPRATIDPILKRYARSGEGNFFLTAKTAALIMASTRAVHSFDLKFLKRRGMIFVDHRTPSRVSEIVVDETMRNAPSMADRDRDHINSGFRLKVERTMLNRIFSEQILTPIGEGTSEEDQVFQFPDGDSPFTVRQTRRTPCNRGYVYKRFVLSPEVTVVVRGEVDAAIRERGGKVVHCVNRALHQYMRRPSGLWENLLRKSPGSVVLQELTHNSFEMGRWIYEALLADCEVLNVGYLTRRNLNSNRSHRLLMVDRMEVSSVATQLHLRLANGLAVLERIASAILSCPDGDYVLLKIANKQCLHSYQTRLIGTSASTPVPAEETEADSEAPAGEASESGE